MVEVIPDRHRVHRFVDYPRMIGDEGKLASEIIFAFSEYKLEDNSKMRSESVTWERYAQTTLKVHRLGRKRERDKLSENPSSKMRYAGFITAHASNIRSIRTPTGKSFVVVHVPKEGRHHAEIRFFGNPSKGERDDLKQRLPEVFGPLIKNQNVSWLKHLVESFASIRFLFG